MGYLCRKKLEVMENYVQTDELQKLINWDVLMGLPRYAGGHDEQMQNLFKEAKVIAHWNEGDYQGIVATCVLLPDGRYAIYNDYYGSCSGCDSWEDATDEEVRRMCVELSNSTYIFDNLDEVKGFLAWACQAEVWSSWNGAAESLLGLINKLKEE